MNDEDIKWLKNNILFFDKNFFYKKFNLTQKQFQKIQKEHNIYKRKPYKNMSKDIFVRCWKNSLKRKIKFNISLEESYDLLISQQNKCALSGLNIKIRPKADSQSRVKNSASIDRINSSKGYERNNIFWTHQDINIMRWDLPLNYFLSLCELVYKKINNPIEYNYAYIQNDNINSYLSRIKHRSIVKKLKYNLNSKKVFNKFKDQNGICELSGLPLILPMNSITNNKLGCRHCYSASIDRIKHDEGYTIDNIRWIHKDINIMRWTFPDDKFINYCKLITENRKKK